MLLLLLLLRSTRLCYTWHKGITGSLALRVSWALQGKTLASTSSNALQLTRAFISYFGLTVVVPNIKLDAVYCPHTVRNAPWGPGEIIIKYLVKSHTIKS